MLSYYLRTITEGTHTTLIYPKKLQRRQVKPLHKANYLDSMGGIQHWPVLDRSTHYILLPLLCQTISAALPTIFIVWIEFIES